MADDLSRLRSAALRCNCLARKAVEHFSNPPLSLGRDVWNRETRCPKAEIKDHLEPQREADGKRLFTAVQEWTDAAFREEPTYSDDEPLPLVERAVGLKASPVFIGKESYQTATEAAVYFCEAVHDLLLKAQSAGDGCGSNFEDAKWLAEKLAPFQSFPDLNARIEGEFHEAVKLRNDGRIIATSHHEKKKRRMSRNEANARALEA